MRRGGSPRIALFGAICAAHANFIYTSINDPSAVAYAQPTVALGINVEGEIVGWYRGPLSSNQGFLYSGGTYTTINGPPGTSSNTTSRTGANSCYGLMLGPPGIFFTLSEIIAVSCI